MHAGRPHLHIELLSVGRQLAPRCAVLRHAPQVDQDLANLQGKLTMEMRRKQRMNRRVAGYVVIRATDNKLLASVTGRPPQQAPRLRQRQAKAAPATWQALHASRQPAHLLPRGKLLVKLVVPVRDLYVDVQLQQAAVRRWGGQRAQQGCQDKG